MSKKKKAGVVNQSAPAQVAAAQPRPSATSKIPVSKTSSPPATVVAESERGFELIRFDRRVKWFVGICIGLFVILTVLKINYSSVAMWNTVIPDGSDARRGIIAGTPKSIRMDEWAVSTPAILSQYYNDFPLENPAIGGQKPALVGYLPVHHFISVFRPDYWGFFLLSLEMGFAWWWQFKVIGSVVALTLLFLLLTQNNFWLSVFGAVWLVFSPGIAWWSYYLLPTLFPGVILLIASIYIFYARSLRTLLIAGPLFVWSMVSFALALYPPYQVPLGYLLIALLIGFLAREFHKEWLFDKIWMKAATFAIAFGVLGTILYLYYSDAKSTIDAMSSTVYPGKRSEVGGTGFIANWFSEYYSWLVSNTSFPKEWLNICELSHFITFAPIIIPSLLLIFVYTKKIDPLLVSISIFVLVLLAWIQIGFPDWLAKISLLNVSPTRRTQIPFGVGNVFLTVLYVDYLKRRSVKVSGLVTALSIVAVIAFMVYAAVVNLDDSNGFFKVHQIFLPTLLFIALAILLLPFVQIQYRNLVFCIGVLFFLLPGLKANPIAVGLSPITDNALYKTVRELHLQDPKARWVVMGSQYITYLVTATGVNQLSGVKNQPDFKTMRVLDPTAKRDSAYNRYAHTVYNSFIDGKDSVFIQNNFEDAYTVGVDPCSPKLKKLNVKYFIFDRHPQAVETRCLRQVRTLGSLEIYRVNE
ncbi:hypothetical protein ACFSUS_17185 [Spirosoma soli]|uniref:YfhO family protein n=1 Tax=Spirosoma soli TaxID=1770529 RepID=A0ABW5M9M4_9BACT